MDRNNNAVESDATSPSPMEVGTRFEAIYTIIRERVCLLDYEPGTRLSEEKLAKEFGVSRTPIRRVLVRLEAEGLVEVRHGAGNFVTDIEPGYLCEVYRLRMELVTLIGRLAPLPVSKDLLSRLRALKSRISKIPVAQAPKRQFARINIDHFLILMELVGNRPLKETLERLYFLSARMWPYLMREDVVVRESRILRKEIGETVRILKTGGISSLGHLLRGHIEMALQRLIEMGPPCK